MLQAYYQRDLLEAVGSEASPGIAIMGWLVILTGFFRLVEVFIKTYCTYIRMMV